MVSWQEIIDRYTKDPVSITKTGKTFRVSRITETAVYIDLFGGEQSVSSASLERAVALLKSGVRIEGPADYKREVCDERPAYAWAILRNLGVLK